MTPTTTEIPLSAPQPVAPQRVLGLTRKSLFKIHGWLGMVFGSLLFVICASGAAAALSYEIDWLLNPALRVSPAGKPALSWGAWIEAARSAHPDWKPRWVSAPPNRYTAVEVIEDAPSGLWRRVYVNPYTGVVQGGTSYFNVQRFLRDFHRLLNVFSYGLVLVSSFGIFLVFSVVSGLLFYKNWYRNLFRLRLTKGRHAFWSDMHRLTGVWSFLFALIIGITGVWYLTEHILYANHWATAEQPVKLSPQSLVAHGNTPRPLDTDSVVLAARRAMPDLDIRKIWFPVTLTDPVRVEGQAAAWLVQERANQVVLDPYSGEVLAMERAEQAGAYKRWGDTADPLHFGDFGGIPTKILWSLFGMALPAMVLTGSYLSLRQSQRPTPKAYRLGACISALLFATSLYYSVPAATRYKTPAVPAWQSQGTIVIGSWRFAVAAANHTVRIETLCDTCVANFQSISIAAGDGKPVALKAKGKYWIGEKVGTGAYSLIVQDWSGRRYAQPLNLDATALNASATYVPDEGAYTGVGTWFFVIPFLMLLTGVVGYWTYRFGIRRT